MPETQIAVFHREQSFMKQVASLLGDDTSGTTLQKSLREAAGEFGGLCEHDLFMPAGLTLPILCNAIVVWDEDQKAAGNTGIKLPSEFFTDWWRYDSSVQSIPTEAGILRVDLGKLVAPTDLQGRPFNLSYGEQLAWAGEQGGDDIMSVEEILFIVLRKMIRRNVAPWGAGAALRCRNSCKPRGQSESRLTVGWNASRGLNVGHCNFERNPSIGALSRKFVALR